MALKSVESDNENINDAFSTFNFSALFDLETIAAWMAGWDSKTSLSKINFREKTEKVSRFYGHFTSYGIAECQRISELISYFILMGQK